MKDIKNFHIGKAYYFLENRSGSRLKLSVDYAQKSFGVKVLTNGNDPDRLKEQAAVIARDMLSRKGKRNLVYKLVQLELKK